MLDAAVAFLWPEGCYNHAFLDDPPAAMPEFGANQKLWRCADGWLALPLAGAAARPMRQLPDVPAAARSLPGFDVSVWHGIVGPAGMDPALVSRINAVFNQVLQSPQVRTAITEAQSADIIGGTPQQFDAFIKEELKRWPEVVRAAGIKSE